MTMPSLWGAEFDELELNEKKKTKSIVKKASSSEKKRSTSSKPKLTLSQQIEEIRKRVYETLGEFADDTICIRDVDEYERYIDACIRVGRCGFDTETNNSLIPHTCKIMGLCLYTEGQKHAYIPVNHIDLYEYEQGNEVRLPNQLTEEQIAHGIKRLLDNNVELDLSNGKFDYQVILHTCDLKITIDYDTQSVAQLLNENELKGLKSQYVTHIDPSSEKYDIENLFEKLPYAIIPPELFALYSATDAFKTYVLADWQKEQLELDDNKDIKNLYYTIEQPLHTVVADMEWRGVMIDKDFAERLSKRYHRDLDNTQIKIAQELSKLDDAINEWRKTPEANIRYLKDTWIAKNPNIPLDKYAIKEIVGNKEKWRLTATVALPFKIDDACSKSLNQQLSDPVVLTSPTQVAILLYDVLKVGVIDKKSPRSTSESVMEQLADKIPLCNVIQEQKHLIKMLSTYIDKLPAQVIEETGALHCHFLQDGTVTGRFASNDPNTQNIPSSIPEIRLMFKARDGYDLIGSDFSAQEPRLTAVISQDTQMIQAYQEGKDLYRVIATKIFNNTYEDNGEAWSDGTPNPEGKHRRKVAKKVLLSITYGETEQSLASDLNCTVQEAHEILYSFITGFPELGKWISDVKEFAHKHKYVVGLLGRRRNLPDIGLPKYDVRHKDAEKNKTRFFNPLLRTSGVNKSLSNDKLICGFIDRCNNSRGEKELSQIKSDAYKHGIEIFANSARIATAERQSVNAIIQGSASTMTKHAMYLCATDPYMIEHDCHMLIPIHDELLCECPKEYTEGCSKRLTELMIQSAIDLVGTQVPFKCDPTIMERWYEDEITAQYQEFVEKRLLSTGITDAEAFNQMLIMHPEFTEDEMHFFIDDCFNKKSA